MSKDYSPELRIFKISAVRVLPKSSAAGTHRLQWMYPCWHMFIT